MIELQNVSVSFRHGGQVVQALKDVSLTIEDSEYLTVVGPNGAGKSTLVNVIAGSVFPDRGRIVVDGKNVTSQPDYQRARYIARVFADPTMSVCEDLTIGENMALAHSRPRRRSPFRRAANRDVVRQTEQLLKDFGRGLDDRLGQTAGRLSSGQRQLISVFMALTAPPQVLLLDEHTSALDPEMSRAVMDVTDQLVRTSAVTTLMITHNMLHACRYGKRLVILVDGRVVADIAGKEKTSLTEDELIRRFREVVSASLTDRLLGAT
jgi:putative ABC transport system ATP-binding protein